MMHSSFVTSYFYALSAISIILLWGISLVNGTVWALVKTAFQAKLPDGRPFQASYTGLPILDFPIALLVAFFNSGTNDQDHAYQIFLLNAYATLQPAYVWLYIETARFGKALPFTKSPIFFGLLWQMFGAAISLPLFYAQHLEWALSRKAVPKSNVNQVRSIPLGLLLGAVLPVLIGMYPAWTGSNARDPRTHQYIIAAFQPDPVWVSLIQSVAVTLCARFMLPRYSDNRSSSVAAETSYWLAAAVSFISHLHMIWQVVYSLDPGMTWTRMFLPTGIYGPSNASDILVRGPWLFLQYDFLIIALSSLSWAAILLRQSDSSLQFPILVVFGAIGSITIGAGTMVSLLLLQRERNIRRMSGLERKPKWKWSAPNQKHMVF